MFTKTLSGAAQNSLAVLGKSGLVKEAYLAGGPALALYFGHRYSIDFDFFTLEQFDPLKLAIKLGEIGRFRKETAHQDTLLGNFNGVKFSLFRYPYPLIRKTRSFSGSELADPADIAAMKIAALMDRGSKKDFIDLYFLAKDKFSLEAILKFYNQKYRKLSENIYSILRGLHYFADAEESETPIMIRKADWGEVKQFFQKKTISLARKYL